MSDTIAPSPNAAPGAEANPPKVCVVGSLNMDLVVRAQRIPVAGETVLGGGYKTYPGGKGANQAVAASRMGAVVSMVGCVGDDLHGSKLREVLGKEGLDLSGLSVRAGVATGLALITVAEDGENAIVVAPGANAELTADMVEASAGVLDACDVLLMQLETPNASLLAAAQRARAHGAAVILNAAPARSLTPEFLKLVDVLVVNRSEAARLMGLDTHTDPARLALRLPTLGPSAAILTVGAQGAIVAYKGRPRRISTPALKAVDTVGAGDAFCGALAACWSPVHRAAQKRDNAEYTLAEQAVTLACAAGALAASRHGAIPAMPRRAEVQELATTLRVT